MRVEIDGVEYAPIEKIKGEKVEKALSIRFDSDAGKNGTIRKYLYTMLLVLWNEKESFDSKRPLGNSGWEYDLIEPLVKTGMIKGSMECDGVCVDHESVDFKEYNNFVLSMIRTMFIKNGTI
jgi:hypothetical protein|tara:strand:+ start:797 stop:1162 length:366 start_codon:yes stop_codon:yes gene_type:complete